jgi:beta-barrel assembly-enhancing protease
MKNFHIFLLSCLLPLAFGCQSINESVIANPGDRPDSTTTEAGLWMQMEKIEAQSKTSGNRVKDEKLNSYIEQLVCKLAGEYCSDIRVYVLKVPAFNATMAPNGMMHVWTGLLLRVQNEAQLATVLGHEITHYIKKHSLKRYVDTKNKVNTFTILNLGAGGLLTPVLMLGTIGSIQAYNRDHEREADQGGLKLLSEKGYSLEGAPEVWENIVKEQEASKKDTPSLFLSSHPQSTERIQNLRTEAKKLKTSSTPRIGESDYLQHILPHRSDWFLQELSLKNFKEMEIVLQNLAFSPLHKGELHFLKGELLRKQREKDFETKAIAQYQKAIDLDANDPRPLKAIGLLLLKTDQKQRASENLKKYLSLKPDAEDRSIINSYLKELNV